MRIVLALCLITAVAAESKPAPSPSRSAVAAESKPAPSPSRSPESKPSSHAGANTADVVSTQVTTLEPTLHSDRDRTSSSEDWASHGRAPSAAPAAAPVFKGMPWQTEAGIAVASVAGAAVVAGGIAAAVEMTPQKSARSGAEDEKRAFRASSQQSSKEVGQSNYQPVAAEVPGGPAQGQVTSAPAPASVQLFDDSKQQHADALQSQVMFMSVAGLLLLLACVFLAVSGITYCQKRTARTNSRRQPMCEEEEEWEEEDEECDEELLA